MDALRPNLRCNAVPSLTRAKLAFLALVIPALLLVACSAAEPSLSLPETVTAWKRSSESPIASDAMPESLRRLQVQSGVQALYQKEQVQVQAAVYQLPSPTSAFEAVQTYARQADEYYFHKGSAFVVLNLKDLPMESRRDFLLAFQAAVSPDGPEKRKD